MFCGVVVHLLQTLLTCTCILHYFNISVNLLSTVEKASPARDSLPLAPGRQEEASRGAPAAAKEDLCGGNRPE